jgi:hypothetical protein
MAYTLKELSYLKDIENHKIIYDGYDYIWYANKGNDYELHSIKLFSDYKETLSHIYYWINKYKKEYNKKDVYMDRMLNELLKDVQIKNICKNKDLKTKDKIKYILAINPKIKNLELSNLLDLSKMAISLQIKNLYNL